MPTESSEPPPLELTIVVEPYEPPREPPPTTVAPRVPVDGLVAATAVAALVFACLTWWTVG